MHYYVLYKVLHMKEKNVHTFFLLAKKNLGMCVKWGKIYTWGQGRPERPSLLLSKRVTMIVKFHEKVDIFSINFYWLLNGSKKVTKIECPFEKQYCRHLQG